MAQQLHRSLYEMVVIARIGSMKFLPFMNIAMPRPAAGQPLRNLMRKRAGKTPCIAVHPYFCGRISFSDFGGDRAWQDGR
ncbi:hypothetical protein ABIB06_004587 [Bradyrhizobium sp. LB8.2]|jgi:hypothetical protein|uniref:hypothetical protein n=1 Tax=unclassified Bradyrhizobium TaxID=2631580 RepID=UPI001FF85203|nr:hypothetical protein [Bradyrhizobium sp. 197]MCK1473353.1 hypothetical protein [Bradyrhizobium sp. 197]